MPNKMQSEAMPAALQPWLFCPCGQPPAVAGLCRHCYFARWRSKRRFGGNRDRVLTRDGRACCVCGAGSDVIVHHRRPGQNRTELLATLCRSCHAALHRRAQPAGFWPELLIHLWEEQHHGCPQQLCLGTVPDNRSPARAAA